VYPLGVGNAWCGDDAADLLAAHALRARRLSGATIIAQTSCQRSFFSCLTSIPS
jgi:hypothetical protein